MSNQVRTIRAAQSELHLTDERFLQISGQLRAAYAKIDGSLVDTLLLHATIIETAQEMGLEPEVGQKLFAGFGACLSSLMDGRQKMVAAHTRTTAVRLRTNQAARADGCWPYPGGGIQQEEGRVSKLRAA